MKTLGLLITCMTFTALGYGWARTRDAMQRSTDRQREQARRQAAFVAQRRPSFHPSELANIQERAELDDLRDYIRRGDA